MSTRIPETQGERVFFYRELLNHLDSREHWVPEGDTDDLVEADITEGSRYMQEYVLADEDFNGLLRVDVQDDPGQPVVSGTLTQPLDTTIPERLFEQSELLQQYTRAVENIVDQCASEYVESMDAPHYVAKFEIDRDEYSHDILDGVMYNLADIANQVQGVHDLITYPLQDKEADL